MRVGFPYASPPAYPETELRKQAGPTPSSAPDRVQQRQDVLAVLLEPRGSDPVAGEELASIDGQEELAQRRRLTHQGREELERTLREHGLETAGLAVANFLFSEVGDEALPLFEALLRQGAIVRPMGGFGAPGALRITVGTPDENAFFAEALASVRAATT